jgi:hypothetical protein
MLQVDELATDGLRIVIYVEEAKAASWLATAVGCTSWVKEELSVYLLIPGDMTMPEHNNTSIGEFLTGHLCMTSRISQDMHNPNATVTNNDLALNRQFQHHRFLLNIALHRHDRCYRL